MRAIFLCTTLLGLLLGLLSCSPNTPQSTTDAPKVKTYYNRDIANTLRLITYDVYGQKIAEGRAVYVAHDLVVAPFSLVKGAFSAKVTQLTNSTPYNVYGYAAYDLSADLVVLRVGRRQSEVAPIDTAHITPQDTIFSLDVKQKKTLKQPLKLINGQLDVDQTAGTPIFDNRGRLRGIVSSLRRVVATDAIASLHGKASESHWNIYDLRLKTDKKYPPSTSIAGMRIVTSMGNIEIALSDATPEYRDNFIRLVCDDFYDSLLVHRVLPNYLIQTGAADSKHAKADDVVGWQGPGYKLPMHVVDGLFHKRGAVAASKLPQDLHASYRSDGAQFYIVAGRKISSSDLVQIEKDYHKTFTPQQREAYTTIGGAPYLDGDYTVFAFVTKGMDVVDKIANVELNGDRPKTDIRIKDVEIIWKKSTK